MGGRLSCQLEEEFITDIVGVDGGVGAKVGAAWIGEEPWAPPFLQRLAFLLQLHPISYQEEVKHECIFCSKLHSDPLPFCAK